MPQSNYLHSHLPPTLSTSVHRDCNHYILSRSSRQHIVRHHHIFGLLHLVQQQAPRIAGKHPASISSMHSSNMITALSALGLAFAPLQAIAATSNDWRGRSIYQVLTDRFARTDGSTTAQCNTADRDYCGGSFKGIQNHLDYIQGMGFDSVWISPITAQIEGDTAYGYAYHGYWQKDLYSINSHFGTAQELKDLSEALHSRGMVSQIHTMQFSRGSRNAARLHAFSYPRGCGANICLVVPHARCCRQPQWLERPALYCRLL